ncbi:hypothetical protein CQP05_00470 [Yersinia pestis]|nr:hypothetical protein EGX87_10565 [Yersinia pseudotuberculosis]AYX25865.1 hypothetical protein EGX74_19965 [Yersinia pestis]OSZ92645.1 hypothetical protein A7725_03410 [Yersinia pestis subsp. microtus bv. Caucasica]OVY84282.1 hypothetical protein BFI51_00440 [Yersinia pestis subsp. microtus bv. Xilingolensis]OVY87873.1 hypothetical protein BFI52_00480 [Yersinia pestis subsp. microtus]
MWLRGRWDIALSRFFLGDGGCRKMTFLFINVRPSSTPYIHQRLIPYPQSAEFIGLILHDF